MALSTAAVKSHQHYMATHTATATRELDQLTGESQPAEEGDGRAREYGRCALRGSARVDAVASRILGAQNAGGNGTFEHPLNIVPMDVG